jgi:hypothetical protein
MELLEPCFGGGKLAVTDDLRIFGTERLLTEQRGRDLALARSVLEGLKDTAVVLAKNDRVLAEISGTPNLYKACIEASAQAFGFYEQRHWPVPVRGVVAAVRPFPEIQLHTLSFGVDTLFVEEGLREDDRPVEQWAIDNWLGLYADDPARRQRLFIMGPYVAKAWERELK